MTRPAEVVVDGLQTVGVTWSQDGLGLHGCRGASAGFDPGGELMEVHLTILALVQVCAHLAHLVLREASEYLERLPQLFNVQGAVTRGIVGLKCLLDALLPGFASFPQNGLRHSLSELGALLQPVEKLLVRDLTVSASIQLLAQGLDVFEGEVRIQRAEDPGQLVLVEVPPAIGIEPLENFPHPGRHGIAGLFQDHLIDLLSRRTAGFDPF
mmetsp:Transcript_23227/g.54844  ORF Transcript_23227/g.54844 Transcript_23227/m.54844 type:complete len:211 (+) Transcript_23227:715-1347(+)